MDNKINKKGQLFTMIAILVIFLIFLSFELFSVMYERNTVKTRVHSMDNFLFSITENLERQLYISGFRILFLAENRITSSGEYIDVNNFFNEAFFNESVNNNPEDILIGATYSDILNSLNQKASKMNVKINMSNAYINITQEDPWNVKFSLTSDFIMEDKEGLARWERNQEISAYIPITEFEDPIYVVNTYAKFSRKIKKTPYEGNFVSGTNISNLLLHVNNNFYFADSSSPSFLKRLEGDFSSDENGIESFVNIPDLSSQGIPTYSKSTLDYIYFSSENPVSYRITGMPSWFRIDNQDNHLNKYNISSLAY